MRNRMREKAAKYLFTEQLPAGRKENLWEETSRLWLHSMTQVSTVSQATLTGWDRSFQMDGKECGLQSRKDVQSEHDHEPE